MTVDNRLDNLELVRDNGMDAVPGQHDEASGGVMKNRENSLYWITVTQLLGDPHEMVSWSLVCLGMFPLNDQLYVDGEAVHEYEADTTNVLAGMASV